MGTARLFPMRRCVGCQEMKPKKELHRVIRTPEGEYCLDETGRKNGRGAYLCRNGECLEKAVKSRGLERSFKQAIPEEVYQNLQKELTELEQRQSIADDRPGHEGGQSKKR